MKRFGCVLGALAVLSLASLAGAAVIFDNGGPLGTIEDVSDPANGSVAIVLSPNDDLTDNILPLVEFDKTWLRYQAEPGDPPTLGLPLIVEVRLPAKSAFGPGVDNFLITFADEQVRNLTEVKWLDFHIDVIVISPAGKTAAWSGEGVSPIFNQVDVVGGSVDMYDGELPPGPDFKTLFQSDPNDPVTLTIPLDEEYETIVLIKERPSVPEPATMGLLSLGSFGLMALRRRRKK